MLYKFTSNLKNNGIELKPVVCELEVFLSNAKKAGAVDIKVFDSRENPVNKVVQFTLNNTLVAIMAVAF